MTDRDETRAATHSWIADLDDSIIKRLLQGLQGSEGMVMDHEIYDALTDELWRRNAVPVDTWPTNKSEISDLTFVTFCFDAASPEDANHQPVRALRHEFGAWLECSCGRQEDEDIAGQRWRVPGPHWWPTEIIDGVPHFIMCPIAEFADSREHAPSSILETYASTTWCICGCQYVRLYEEDGLYRGAKVVPAI